MSRVRRRFEDRWSSWSSRFEEGSSGCSPLKGVDSLGLEIGWLSVRSTESVLDFDARGVCDALAGWLAPDSCFDTSFRSLALGFSTGDDAVSVIVSMEVASNSAKIASEKTHDLKDSRVEIQPCSGRWGISYGSSGAFVDGISIFLVSSRCRRNPRPAPPHVAVIWSRRMTNKVPHQPHPQPRMPPIICCGRNSSVAASIQHIVTSVNDTRIAAITGANEVRLLLLPLCSTEAHQLTAHQMLSRRIARASALAAARPLPVIQQRTFIHKPIKGRQEELYPDEPTLTDAEDPGMVGG